MPVLMTLFTPMRLSLLVCLVGLVTAGRRLRPIRQRAPGLRDSLPT